MPATAAEPIAVRRILVYGVTGSGKTTLAERISRATSLPWHSVDDLTWESGWTEVPADEKRRRIEAICADEAWILDTAYVGGSTSPWPERSSLWRWTTSGGSRFNAWFAGR